MAQADEVRALDRLDFIGIFRLFHLVMSKVCTDIKAAMPNMTMVEDKGSLANAAAPALNRYLDTAAVVYPFLLLLQLPGLRHPLLVLGH